MNGGGSGKNGGGGGGKSPIGPPSGGNSGDPIGGGAWIEMDFRLIKRAPRIEASCFRSSEREPVHLPETSLVVAFCWGLDSAAWSRASAAETTIRRATVMAGKQRIVIMTLD